MGPTKAQNFRFSIEAGLLTSQMDGDGLSGFDKLGPKLGIGAVYPLTEQFELAAAGTFYRHGSSRADFRVTPQIIKVDKLEMDIQSVGVSFVFQWRPLTSRLMVGGGPVYHRIFDSEPIALEFRGTMPPRVLEDDTFKTSFIAFKSFIGYEFSDRFRFLFTLEKAFGSLLNVPIEEILMVSPYSFSYTLAYEINPSGAKVKSSTRKKRI